MVITIGSVERVYELLGRSREQLDEASVTMRLEEAERFIKARHGNKFYEEATFATTIPSTGASNKSYNTYFPVKSGTEPTVYVNGVLRVKTTDYSYSDSVLTFSSTMNLLSGDKIAFEYIPAFFDDYANYMAAEKIFAVSLIDTSNAVSKAVYDSLKDQTYEYSRLATKLHVAKFTDNKANYGIF